MKNRTYCLAFAVFALGLLATQDVLSQTLQYAPYGSWRGRAVARDGLFHVQRYHWGNGITPVGGSVLNTVIPVLADVGLAALGREGSRDVGASSRGSTWAGWDEYTKAQEEANALLKRTAALLNQQPLVNNVVPGDKIGTFDPLTVDKLKAKLDGTNPWDTNLAEGP